MKKRGACGRPFAVGGVQQRSGEGQPAVCGGQGKKDFPA